MRKFLFLLICIAFGSAALEEETMAKAKENVDKALNDVTYATLNKEILGYQKGLTMGQMENLLKAGGFEAIKSKIDDEGYMKFSAKSGGFPFIIQGDNCEGQAGKQQCSYFEIAASFLDSKNPYDYDLMNQWNIDQRWSKAYLTQDGEAILTQEIFTDYATAGAILLSLQGWRHSLAEFAEHIHW
ncbi:MAG: YbjN domain-containing protein [Alphaproteobacteria bacterium]